MVTEDVFDRLLAARILEISLYPQDEDSNEEPETLQINVSEEKVTSCFPGTYDPPFLNKEVEEDIETESGLVLAMLGTSSLSIPLKPSWLTVPSRN